MTIHNDIREQALRDAEILRDFSLVNGGTRKECCTCAYARRDCGLPRNAPVCWSCRHYPLIRPDVYTKKLLDNWLYAEAK